MSISLKGAHRALADARATAELLAAYIVNTPRTRAPFWEGRLVVANLLDLPLPSLLDQELRDVNMTVPHGYEITSSGFSVNPGDRVCLTGTMVRDRDEWISILGDAGIIVWPSVTKKVKLFVAADPDSLSRTVQKARSYGIPIVGEQWLAERFSV